MKIVLIVIVVAAIAAASWFIFLRGDNNQSVVRPPVSGQQQPGQSGQPPARTFKSPAEIRAEREKAAAEEEKFNEPPQIKIPDFGGSEGAEKKGSGPFDPIVRIWNVVTFLPGKVLWVIENPIAALIIIVVIGWLISKVTWVLTPFKWVGAITWEIAQTMFLHRSISDAFSKDKDKKKGAGGKKKKRAPATEEEGGEEEDE